MAISEQIPAKLDTVLVANTFIYIFDFTIFHPDDLKVNIVPANGNTTEELVRITDFTITKSNNDPYTLTGEQYGRLEGGKVVLNSTYTFTAGDTLVMYRDVPENRLTAYTNSSEFLASTLDIDIDRLIAMIQEINYDVTRTVRLDPNDTSTSSLVIPINNRADSILAFDDTGNLITTPTSDFLNNVLVVSDWVQNNIFPAISEIDFKTRVNIPTGTIAVTTPAGQTFLNQISLDDQKTYLNIPITGTVATIADITTALNDYVTTSSLNTTLNGYVTTSTLNNELANYTTTANLQATYLTQNDAANTYATQSVIAVSYYDKTQTYSKTEVDTLIANSESGVNSTYLTVADAQSTYLTKTEASSTYLTQTQTDALYATATSYTQNFLDATTESQAKTAIGIPPNTNLSDPNTAIIEQGTLALTTTYAQEFILTIGDQNSFNNTIANAVSASLGNPTLTEACSDPILVEQSDNTQVTCSIGTSTDFMQDTLFKAREVSSLRRMLSKEGDNVATWTQAKLADPRSPTPTVLNDVYVPLATEWLQNNFFNSISADSARQALNIADGSYPIVASTYMRDNVFPAVDAVSARNALDAQKYNELTRNLGGYSQTTQATVENAVPTFDTPTTWKLTTINSTDNTLANIDRLATQGMIRAYVDSNFVRDVEVNSTDDTLGTIQTPAPFNPNPIDPTTIIATQDMVVSYVNEYVNNAANSISANFENNYVPNTRVNSSDSTLSTNDSVPTNQMIRSYVGVQIGNNTDFIPTSSINSTDEALTDNDKLATQFMIRCYVMNRINDNNANLVTNMNAVQVADDATTQGLPRSVNGGSTCSISGYHAAALAHQGHICEALRNYNSSLISSINAALTALDKKYTDLFRELAQLTPTPNPTPAPVPPSD